MTEITQHIENLLAEVEALKKLHPQKEFTLDGRLVGDIGEVLAEQSYKISLKPGLPARHDALTDDGRDVQIKTTMKNSLTFPADHVPDYYLGIKVHTTGRLEEVFNGPGSTIKELLKNQKRPKNNQHHLSIKRLKKLNSTVDNKERIEGR